MDQRAIAELAEHIAILAEAKEAEGIDDLIRRVSDQYHYAPWAIANMIAGEWKRQGIIPTPILVPRGTYARNLNG